MPRYEITAPDGRRFEVSAPDGASNDEVLAYAQKNFAATKPDEPANPTDGMSRTERVLAGAGKAFVDVGRGAGQLLSKVTGADKAGAGLVSEQDVAESRKRDQPLMNTGLGVTGNIVGNIAAMAPAMMIPGANTVVGAGVIGAASGAAQPTVEGESSIKNAAIGGALGSGAQYGLGKIVDQIGKRLAGLKDIAAVESAKNSVRDSAVAASREAGYKTVPSESGGNLAGRIVEGLTGKEKAAQLAAVQNQPITDALARKALGLADDVPLSKETMRTVRADAAKAGYDPVRNVPEIQTDGAYQDAVGKLTSRADNAAKDFGALVESDVKPLADGLKQIKAFSGDSAVDAISIFREKSSDLYAQGNKTLGKAYREAAEAIEGQVERSISGGQGRQGGWLEFRAARTKMAQSFDLEKALREGQGTIDARVIGRLYGKNPERMSGELETIGKAASAMPGVMGVPKAGWSNPVTAWTPASARWARSSAAIPCRSPTQPPALRRATGL
jgi:hypothetical protein